MSVPRQRTNHLSRIRNLIPRLFIDSGPPEAAAFICGMGRSGTTLVGDIVNHGGNYRVIFEPFFPARVNEARPFGYIQYIRPDERDPALTAAVRTIIAGKLRNRWVDVENRKMLYKRRIVKSIRANLMLRWLREIFPSMPIVFVIRHPLAVSASWLALGWGVEEDGTRPDLDILMAQRALLEDFPLVGANAQMIDATDALERVLFEWCVFHHVPLTQFRDDELFVLPYERLLLDAENETGRLFEYLRIPRDDIKLAATLRTASMTNVLGRDVVNDKDKIVFGWRDTFTDQQIRRAHEILGMFGLERLYGADGRPQLREAAAPAER